MTRLFIWLWRHFSEIAFVFPFARLHLFVYLFTVHLLIYLLTYFIIRSVYDVTYLKLLFFSILQAISICLFTVHLLIYLLNSSIYLWRHWSLHFYSPGFISFFLLFVWFFGLFMSSFMTSFIWNCFFISALFFICLLINLRIYQLTYLFISCPIIRLIYDVIYMKLLFYFYSCVCIYLKIYSRIYSPIYLFIYSPSDYSVYLWRQGIFPFKEYFFETGRFRSQKRKGKLPKTFPNKLTNYIFKAY